MADPKTTTLIVTVPHYSDEETVLERVRQCLRSHPTASLACTVRPVNNDPIPDGHRIGSYTWRGDGFVAFPGGGLVQQVRHDGAGCIFIDNAQGQHYAPVEVFEAVLLDAGRPYTLPAAPEEERGDQPDRITRLREAAEAGYSLSLWAASINWDGSPNITGWLDGLRGRIVDCQSKAAAAGIERRGMTLVMDDSEEDEDHG